MAVQFLNGLVGVLAVAHLDEPETSGTPGAAVGDQLDLRYLAVVLLEQRAHRGFIRAETISYDDYIALGGEAGAKEAGKMRQEGKDYDVKDGDVMHFKFNV